LKIPVSNSTKQIVTHKEFKGKPMTPVVS